MDDIGWNVNLELELLSKVLSSLDGLEREAQIALSARFSKLDFGYESTTSPTDQDGDGGSIRVRATRNTKTRTSAGAR